MKQLTSKQRCEIYLGLKRGWTKTFIANEIGVHPSTVCREIKRNSNSHGEYVWLSAQEKSNARKHSFAGNNRKPPELWWRIEQLILEEDWSPSVISGVLAKEGIHVCKQTIYNHVHADFTGKLAPHMPHELKYRKRINSRKPTKANLSFGQIKSLMVNVHFIKRFFDVSGIAPNSTLNAKPVKELFGFEAEAA